MPPRTRRPRPLRWITTDGGALIPDCYDCFDLLISPMFVEAVSSVAIEHPGRSASDVAKSAITGYHTNNHRDMQ